MSVSIGESGFHFGGVQDIESSTFDEVTEKWVFKYKPTPPEFDWMNRLPAGCSWIISNEDFLRIRDRRGHVWFYQKRGKKHGAVPQFYRWLKKFNGESYGPEVEWGPCLDFRRWRPLRCL